MTPEELAHQQRVAGYLAKIKRLWFQAMEEAAAMAGNLRGYDPSKPFNAINYPQTKKEMDRLLTELHDQTQIIIEKGIDIEWLEANLKNDRLVKGWSKSKPRPPERWMQHNEGARDAFKIRKDRGMNLSDRVWKLTNEHKSNLEMAIDMALYEGKSAQLLSQDIRQNLLEPNRLYRRVRDARGNLHLSKNALAYHSGQGVYRSSYKNAMRLARTENNLAYRYSDFYRTAQLDFVLGFEVHLSNNHTINGVPFVDICDDLKGKYPKGFKFGGWHPQCRCYVTQILMDEDEFDMIEDKMLAGEDISGYVSRNTIWSPPKGFDNWVSQNMKRSEGWKSQPYWVRDNFKGGTLRGGLQIGKAVPPPPPIPPPVPPPVPKPPVPEPPPVPPPAPKPVLPDTFVPAQSIDDAITFGNKTLGIEFEGEFSLDQLNAINRGHWRVKRTLGQDFPLDINKYRAMSTEDMKWMMSRREGNTLLLNKKNFGDKAFLDSYHTNQIQSAEKSIIELKTKLQQHQYSSAAERAQIEMQIKSWEMQVVEWKARPSFIPRTPDEFIISQHGKDLRAKLSKHGLDVDLEVKLGRLAGEDGLLLSEYATTGGVAYIEEAWVAYIRGEFYKINPELKAVFDKAVKIKPTEVKAPVVPKPKPEPKPIPEPPPQSKEFEWQNSTEGAEKWAKDVGLASEEVSYKGLTIEEANQINRTLWEANKESPLKFRNIRVETDIFGVSAEFDTLGYRDGSSLYINIGKVRNSFSSRKNLHDKIKSDIKQLEDRLAELKGMGYRKYTAQYNKRIEELKAQLRTTPQWETAADMELEYLNRLRDVTLSGRMEIMATNNALDGNLLQRISDRMKDVLKDSDLRMDYTVRSFSNMKSFLNESYVLYKKGLLKDPYTKDLIEEIIDVSNGKVHIPAKLPPKAPPKRPWDTTKSIHDQLASISSDEDFKKWADEMLNATDMWTGLTPEAKRQVFEEFHNLRTQYGFKRRITLGWESRPNTYASASASTYNLKKTWWNERGKVDSLMENDIRTGWHPNTKSVSGRVAINRHEFGHVLTVNPIAHRGEFYDKLSEIRKAYNAKKKQMFRPVEEEIMQNNDKLSALWRERNKAIVEVEQGRMTGDEFSVINSRVREQAEALESRNKALREYLDNPNEDWYISRYAEKNADEFAAECFAYSFEADCKNEFAIQVRALIDEYFKGNL